ncbi:MAG: SDR family oxidoreductase [Proteobacteria bacterium]|nr:SDR family oxidoreductase [Pseudomonadota bacterium]
MKRQAPASQRLRGRRAGVSRGDVTLPSPAGVALTFPEGAALIVGCGNIGGAAALRLGEAGVPVVLTYRGNARRARALVRQIQARGGQARAHQLDLLQDAAVGRVVRDCARDFGRLHSVVYAAGPPIPFLRVRDMPPRTLERHLLADSLGCFRLFHHAIPVLERGGGGSLTAIVTMANYRAIDTDGLSAIPKAAVESLVRQVAAEEAAAGIRANAVPIGWVGGFASSFAEARAYTAAMTGPEAPATRALMERLMSFIRMGRPGTAQEVGNIVAFLASEQASYVTGCVIAADGGAIL